MKSLCIKNNNLFIINYLFNRFSSLNLDSFYVSENKFKLYNNIIVHYTSDNTDLFYDKVCTIITDTIIDFYENKLLKRLLEYNYFYFTSSEKKKILSLANEFLKEDKISKEDNFFAIYYSVLDYIKEHKSLILDGFVNFRIQNYIKNLDYIIDISVNKYLIEKEYNEFVNILKLYVSSSSYNSSLIHLIYFGNDSILLDKEKNIIPLDDTAFKAEYLSNITFTSNDFALNTLLNLTPKKLIIHLVNRKI